VYAGYSGSKGYGLVDRRLYLPQKWFEEEYQSLCRACDIPEGVTFKTKVEQASEMIRTILASGLFQARWIGCDSFLGNSKAFLDAIPEGYYYFADVHANTLVWRETPQMVVPAYKGRGRHPNKPKFSPAPVSTLAEDESLPWQKVFLGEGAKGPIIAQVKCCRVVACRDNLPDKEVWLYIRRYEDGRIKHSLCDAPSDTPLETLHRVATLRGPIEQCFEECKRYLGMSHYDDR
jgi:SRSO17 transposase